MVSTLIMAPLHILLVCFSFIDQGFNLSANNCFNTCRNRFPLSNSRYYDTFKRWVKIEKIWVSVIYAVSIITRKVSVF